MFILVITGGLGSGKTTAAEFFRERGAVVIGLDKVASDVLVPGSPELERLAATFGRDIIGEDGGLDRRLLAQRAFASRENAALLNKIVHPAVAGRVGPAISDLRLLPHQPTLVVLEVPLLAEAPVYAELADEVLAISAPIQVRVSRSVARGLDEADAFRRIALQASDEERESLASTVIVNDGSREEYVRKLEDYWDSRFGDVCR
jgi:dephospho-CoA kinase